MNKTYYQSRPVIASLIWIARALTGLISLAAALFLAPWVAVLALAAWFGQPMGQSEVPFVEALACLSGFVLVVSSALFWGLWSPRRDEAIRLAQPKTALVAILLIVEVGGALFWGFLHFGT